MKGRRFGFRWFKGLLATVIAYIIVAYIMADEWLIERFEACAHWMQEAFDTRARWLGWGAYNIGTLAIALAASFPAYRQRLHINSSQLITIICWIASRLVLAGLTWRRNKYEWYEGKAHNNRHETGHRVVRIAIAQILVMLGGIMALGAIVQDKSWTELLDVLYALVWAPFDLSEIYLLACQDLPPKPPKAKKVWEKVKGWVKGIEGALANPPNVEGPIPGYGRIGKGATNPNA